MAILICDANIFIDLDQADICHLMFDLDETFVVVDILYVEELEERHSDLIELGLVVESSSPESVSRVSEFQDRYTAPGYHDLLCLAHALDTDRPLCTGDGALRSAAEAEGVEVHGTLWIIEIMFEQGVLSVDEIETAYQEMRNGGRRLPWDEVESQIKRLQDST